MDLFLDICTGLGIAAAAGIRPFLPAVLAGMFALANWAIDFDGTGFAFLESPIWIGALAVLFVLSFFLARRDDGPTHPVNQAVVFLSGLVGALLFAGALADHGRESAGWVLLGVLAGAAAAWLANAAVRDLAARTARRLDDSARRALPLWFEVVAMLLAALSIVLPPVSLVAVPFLAWLLLGGRKREGGKYAGLRVLR